MSDDNSVITVDLSKPVASAPAPEAQLPQEEAPKQEIKPEVDAKEQLFSSKFANLTRKEREILAKEKAIKQQSEELQKLQELKGSAKERVEDALEMLGLTLDDVIQYELKKMDAQEPEDDSLEGKYKKLEQKLTEFEKKELEKVKLKEEEEKKREQQYIDETISTFKQSISAFIEEKSETYELIAAQDAQDTVFEVIEEHFNQTGKVLAIEEAANLVEQHLEEEAKRILSRSKKLKSALPSEEVESQASEELKVSQQTQPKKTVAPTLTSEVTASQAKVEAQEWLSREESLRRAAEKLKWNN